MRDSRLDVMQVIFVHMPKCAGASMRDVFKGIYGDKFKLDYDSYCRIPQKDRFAKILADSAGNKGVVSDGMVFGHFSHASI